MFDFLRKKAIWAACDAGYLDELKSKNISYQLKNAQDLAIYLHVRDARDLDIAEIGGGNSRILERLGINNRCTNIEKFEGKDLGPSAPVALSNVRNLSAYVGEFSEELSDESFDLVFSISVVEHVETEKLARFFQDSLRILKPGGRFLHAIDLYLQRELTPYTLKRFETYRMWVTGHDAITPIGPVFDGECCFTTDMVSNPDNILYSWNRLAPALKEVREISQSVSLLVGGMKSTRTNDIAGQGRQ